MTAPTVFLRPSFFDTGQVAKQWPDSVWSIIAGAMLVACGAVAGIYSTA